MRFETAARSHVGRRRKINEDAVLARDDLGLWVVADGMGGHDAGEVASALVVDMLAEPPAKSGLAARTEELRTRLQTANDRLQALATATASPRTIGTTAVVLLAEPEGFSALWVGDSRIYQARDAAIEQLTRDHSLVQELVDLGEISEAEARVHPNGNVITRAIGAEDVLQVDVIRGELRAGDGFLLASDGLTRLIEPDELLSALRSPSLAQAADALLQASLDRGAPDNVSFVLIRADAL